MHDFPRRQKHNKVIHQERKERQEEMSKIIKHHKENNAEPCECGCVEKRKHKGYWKCKKCYNERYNAWMRKYRKTEGYRLAMMRQSLAYGAA
jgi:hypothetical protein